MTTPLDPNLLARQDAYYAKQVRILRTLDALRAMVIAHGAAAAGSAYGEGMLEPLSKIQHHLDAMGCSGAADRG